MISDDPENADRRVGVFISKAARWQAQLAALRGILLDTPLIEIEKKGLRVEKPKDDLDPPEELTEALAADPDLTAAFDALTPGRHRSWILHVSQSRKPETRTARIERAAPKIRAGKGWNNASPRIFLALACLTTTPAFAQETSLMRPSEESCGLSLLAFSRHKIVSASMEPNFVTNRCYGFAPLRERPNRGDVVTFPLNGNTHLMRLIGLPGDTVEMRQGRLILNGAPVPTEPYKGERPDCQPVTDCAGDWLIESLPDGPSYLVTDLGPTRIDDMPPVTVPEGRVFVLGDNRDNAADSRIPVRARGMGLILLESLQRRAKVAE